MAMMFKIEVNNHLNDMVHDHRSILCSLINILKQNAHSNHGHKYIRELSDNNKHSK